MNEATTLLEAVRASLAHAARHNPGDVVAPPAELAVEKGAAQVLMPIAARRQLLDLPDQMATKINVVFYADPADAFMKAIVE